MKEKDYTINDLANGLKILNRNLEKIYNRLDDLENKLQEIDSDIFSIKMAVEEIRSEL